MSNVTEFIQQMYLSMTSTHDAEMMDSFHESATEGSTELAAVSDALYYDNDPVRSLAYKTASITLQEVSSLTSSMQHSIEAQQPIDHENLSSSFSVSLQNKLNDIVSISPYDPKEQQDRKFFFRSSQAYPEQNTNQHLQAINHEVMSELHKHIPDQTIAKTVMPIANEVIEAVEGFAQDCNPPITQYINGESLGAKAARRMKELSSEQDLNATTDNTKTLGS
ncbi:hypothetical protein AB4254_11385 [Vibrio breoganii]